MKCYFSSMRTRFPISIFTAMALIASALFSNQAHADAQAEKILEGVRLSATLQQNNLTGHLRKKGKRIPIGLFLRGENIQFQFYKDKTWQKFHMRLKKDNFDLFEIVNDKTVKFPDARLGQPIVGTDLTYEDQSWQRRQLQHCLHLGPSKIRRLDAGSGIQRQRPTHEALPRHQYNESRQCSDT